MWEGPGPKCPLEDDESSRNCLGLRLFTHLRACNASKTPLHRVNRHTPSIPPHVLESKLQDPNACTARLPRTVLEGAMGDSDSPDTA